ncbi:hypothetical protein BBAD15_g8087 [Beauveria bassiana D1-5]|uniref:Uncharacterized protein n=1 Tax=Beauveria bassiana D1-5 TaxID=1245745 RepID=A0A0A2W0U6_BEABA|nr:hypothetical protein BBAD15_g8087 [Beauveria bassiana D1-5]
MIHSVRAAVRSWVLQPGEPRVLRKEGGVGDGLLRHEELIVGAGQVRHGEAAGVVAVLQDEQQARGGAGEERADAVGQQRLVVLAGDLAAGDDDDGAARLCSGRTREKYRSGKKSSE